MVRLNILKTHASNMNIKDILSNVFKAHGFIVTENENLLAVKDEKRIVIGYKENNAVKEDLGKILSAEADKRIFVSTRSFDETIKIFAKESGIILWDREQLEKETGKAVLLGMEGFFENKKEVIIKPRIGLKDAKSMGKKLVNPSADLELVPYYVYTYVCEVLIEGRLDTKKNTGTVAVNAVTMNAEGWKTDFETGTPDFGYAKIPLRCDEQKALSIARQKVIEINTKVVEVKDEKETAIVFEKRRIRPKEDAMIINLIGLYYFPIWNIKGKTGSLIINGVTGEIIKEDIFKKPVLADEKIDVI